MDQDQISLQKLNQINTQKENESNIKYDIKKNSLNKINFPDKFKINIKRTREYSPLMDLDDEEEDNNLNKKNNMNKRRKVPVRKLVERITLNDLEQNLKKNESNPKKKRSIKIFSDMSISEVSNNLFKNYYPCVLPDYYTEQISQQIIDNQIDKLTSNFIKEKNDLMKNKKIKINQNMDYLRQLAEKQGEWIDQGQDVDDRGDNYDEEDEPENKSYDSNDENNSRNEYPEDESIEQQEEQEGDFDENYDYYENDGNYDDE